MRARVGQHGKPARGQITGFCQAVQGILRVKGSHGHVRQESERIRFHLKRSGCSMEHGLYRARVEGRQDRRWGCGPVGRVLGTLWSQSTGLADKTGYGGEKNSRTKNDSPRP